MTPLLMGESPSTIFGILQEPPDEARRDHGVLLCPPIAQEHIRSHWAMRQLAQRLCRLGYHVLRFDWSGVGDSSGLLAEASVERWIDDAQTAARELRDASGVSSISLVGLRFGAALAALAAGPAAASRLLLWDPVLDGREYIDRLRILNRRALTDPRRFGRAVVPMVVPDLATELVGVEFGGPLIADIRTVTLDRLAAAIGAIPVGVMLSTPAGRVNELQSRLAAAGNRVTVQETSLQARWDSVRDIEELLLPGDAVRAAASLLGDESAS